MSDILSSISILLVFATIAFDIFMKKAHDFQNEEELDSEATERIKSKMKRKKLLIKEFIFLLVSLIILFYVQLPTTVNILKNSIFSIWNFETVSTLFILINLGILIILVISFIKLIKIIKIKK
jgi:hypothetical protein